MFTVAEAKRLTGGGLGYPSKMPGTSYGISAHDCITGAKLAKVEGSVCHGCYALKGNYGFANVQKSQRSRMASLAGAGPLEAQRLELDREARRAVLVLALVRLEQLLVVGESVGHGAASPAMRLSAVTADSPDVPAIALQTALMPRPLVAALSLSAFKVALPLSLP